MSAPQHELSQAETYLRQEIIARIRTALGDPTVASELTIANPPNTVAGDYTVSCFVLAKELKRSPAELAGDLAASIASSLPKRGSLITQVKSVGPYLNIFVDRTNFAELVIGEISKSASAYGTSKTGKGKKVMLEYFSPNTNKPLTIGHVRNIVLGWSLARLLREQGYKVTESTLFNNRGIAISKTIVGYLKWGESKTPADAGMKPDHFVGNFYVRFALEARENPELEKEATRVLQRWEEGDKEILAVWQKLTRWVLEGFEQTLTALGSATFDTFDERYYENEYYQHGKELVEAGLRQGVFVKGDDGVVIAPLSKFGLADKVVLRPDDTSLYVTQDLHLATLKARHQPDVSIYVVGSEQDLYFKQLFAILEQLEIIQTAQCRHLSYGMIRLPSGRIKSREGLAKGTGADDLLAELERLARAEIQKRTPDIAAAELQERATQIALGALKFYILQVDPKTTMIFDPDKSIAFTGRTGPYLQYMHARICSIFAKSKTKPTTKVSGEFLTDDATFSLIKLLARYPEMVGRAAEQYAPSVLADYLYELAKSFSAFYEQVPVLQADLKPRRARLALVNTVKIVLSHGLGILGITAPERM